MEIRIVRSIVGVVFILILFTGCSNSLSSTITPRYQNTRTYITSIGVTGTGATLAFPAFIEKGYQVKDLGNNSNSAMKEAKRRKIPFLATVDPVGAEGSWWDGVFDFSMRVTDVLSDSVVWSATAEYSQGGFTIDQVKTTKEAMKGLVEDFSKTFPPKSNQRYLKFDN